MCLVGMQVWQACSTLLQPSWWRAAILVCNKRVSYKGQRTVLLQFNCRAEVMCRCINLHSLSPEPQKCLYTPFIQLWKSIYGILLLGTYNKFLSAKVEVLCIQLQQISWFTGWDILWKADLRQWIVLMYCWVHQYPLTDEAEVQQKSAVPVYQYLSDICSWRLMNRDALLMFGDWGVIVQINPFFQPKWVIKQF